MQSSVSATIPPYEFLSPRIEREVRRECQWPDWWPGLCRPRVRLRLHRRRQGGHRAAPIPRPTLGHQRSVPQPCFLFRPVLERPCHHRRGYETGRINRVHASLVAGCRLFPRLHVLQVVGQHHQRRLTMINRRSEPEYSLSQPLLLAQHWNFCSYTVYRNQLRGATWGDAHKSLPLSLR